MHQAAKTVADNVIWKGYTPPAVGSTPLLFDRFIKLVTVVYIISEIATSGIRQGLVPNQMPACRKPILSYDGCR